MKTVRIKIFEFNELSEKAKEKAIQNVKNNFDLHSHYSNEYLETMDKFVEGMLGAKYTNYCLGGQGAHINVILDCFTNEQLELSGLRLARFIWNNFEHFLYKGKYFSLWSKTEKSFKHYPNGYPVLKFRYSKVLKVGENCNLTGVCTDESILAPMYEFLKSPKNITFEELINECLDSFLKDYEKSLDYANSAEYIAEHCEANEIEFLESGKIYN